MYNYNTTLYQREDIQDQSVTTYATVEVACDSSEYTRARNEPHPLVHSHAFYWTTAGVFAFDNATKYCMVVTEAYTEHVGLNGLVWIPAVAAVTRVEIFFQIISSTKTTPLDDLLSGWFCFIQLEDGRIPAVTYARNESRLAVNFKKGIVAGFQANFKGTEAVEETDPQSMHFSHYR